MILSNKRQVLMKKSQVIDKTMIEIKYKNTLVVSSKPKRYHLKKAEMLAKDTII
jgi:hypothetical protein